MTTDHTGPSGLPAAGTDDADSPDDAGRGATQDHRRDDWLTPDGQPVDYPTHVLAHLSDTHLTSAGIRYNGVIDADAALDRAVAVLRAAVLDGRRVDAVVVSGDLTDSGDPDAYHRLEAALGQIALDGGTEIPLIFATGNHDVRRQFHRHLLRLGDTDDPILQVHAVRGLRIIVLDSTIPGHGHGRLLPEHLDALRAELRTPAEAGTAVVLHHAPLPPPSPLLSYFALESHSRRELAAAVAGTDVRLILAGHHHLPQSGTLGAVPVAVAGSTAIRTDPLGPAGHERTFQDGAFNLVELFADSLTVSVIPVSGTPVVFDLDAAGCRAVIEAHPVDADPR
ncbi:MAG TPA: metallophosphoesterase [Nakamurella sp.]|nr:metallophosphoesterase [Nakamurella sp.]